jgi:hypothetical protein
VLATPVRRACAAVIVAATLTGAATAATRSAVDDAKTAATTFLTAFANRDGGTACSMLTPDALARFGGASDCASTFSGGDAASADEDAFTTLALAYTVARHVAHEHHDAFVRKGFGVRALARAIEDAAPSLDVRLGKGPLAAKGQLSTTVVLDTRTSSRRVVLYAESDSGDILRLSGTLDDGADIGVVAQGTPEASPSPAPKAAFTFAFGGAFQSGDGTVLLDVLLQATQPDPATGQASLELLLRMVPVDGRYLVDDLYVSLTAIIGGG